MRRSLGRGGLGRGGTLCGAGPEAGWDPGRGGAVGGRGQCREGSLMGRGLRWGRGPRRGPDRPLDPVQEQQNRQLQEQWEELSSQVPSGDGFRLTLPLGSPTLVPISAASPPPRIIPTPRSPASPALTSPTPQLFYYGEQLSPQRAERQLGTQLVALQVLGWGPEGRSAGVGGALMT